MAFEATGEIIQVEPLAIAPGEPLELYVTFNAQRLEPAEGRWEIRIIVSLNGRFARKVIYTTENEVVTEALPLHFREVMPDYPISGHASLKARQARIPRPPWQALDSKRITIQPVEEFLGIAPGPIPLLPAVEVPPIAELPPRTELLVGLIAVIAVVALLTRGK